MSSLSKSQSSLPVVATTANKLNNGSGVVSSVSTSLPPALVQSLASQAFLQRCGSVGANHPIQLAPLGPSAISQSTQQLLPLLLASVCQSNSYSGTLPIAAQSQSQPSHHVSAPTVGGVSNGITSIAALDTKPTKQASLDVPAIVVRKEQVEAALRSKPQRGRRREELNQLERQELIRTRNRHHAKITRMRKKARYDELVQTEGQLQLYQAKEELEKKRRSAVVEYVKARENMTKTTIEDPYMMHGLKTEQEVKDLFLKNLGDLLEKIDNFTFTVGLESSSSVGMKSWSRMYKYDRDIKFQVERSFGKSVTETIAYNVIGGHGGVSLDSSNNGIAEVEVVVSGTTPKTVISRGFLRLSFAGPSSAKLTSVQWWAANFAPNLQLQVSHISSGSLESQDEPNRENVVSGSDGSSSEDDGTADSV